MTEDDCSLVATSALDVHKIRVGGWDKSFKFVALSFVLEGRVQQISIHFCGFLEKEIL